MFWRRRIAPPVPRNERIRAGLPIASGKGLEFGPLDAPFVSKSEGDVRYVDVMSTEDLRRHISGTGGGYDPARYVDIDYVWNGGDFRAAIGGDTMFDYAVASHVIEHTPNMVGWLNDIASVLKPGGLISLGIPDKRRTFDMLRRDTVTSTVVADFVRGETRPRAHHVFDYCAYATVPLNGEQFSALVHGKLDPATVPRLCTPQEALAAARRAEETDQYTTCHTYVFTPDSFMTIFDETKALGLHSLEVVAFHPTHPHDFEFFALLRTPA